MISSSPEATASSTTYWMVGLSTRRSISLGWALVAGRKRVPRPAAGNTAFRTFIESDNTRGEWERKPGSRRRRVVGRAHLDAELLDPVPEAALRDPQDLGRPRLHALGLLEGVQDHAPLPLLERLVERARQ